MHRFYASSFLLAGLVVTTFGVAQTAPTGLTEQQEIPVPAIRTAMGTLPGVNELPSRAALPDLFTFSNGKKVTTRAEWQQRRAEMRRILEYYAVGQMPPAPDNVQGEEIHSELVLSGKARYRLIRLSFGPEHKLQLHIGIFTPTDKQGPFPAIITQAAEPPGGPILPRLPLGPNQGTGQNVLLMVGPGKDSQNAARGDYRSMPAPSAEEIAATHREVLQRGYALVVYNDNDCAEDTTLREADGSFSFRKTRFLTAYPDYDWGVLAVWAWGASRVADYLGSDPQIDAKTLILTGASRSGKAAMIAAAFDDRLIAAPVVTGGGGIGVYRDAGADHGESLDIMLTKYPNWFSPHLHEFRGHVERLPFDEHWLPALCAPRPFLALEGDADVISLPDAVRHSIEAARAAYTLQGVSPLKIGVHYSHHAHAFTAEDWSAILDFMEIQRHGAPEQAEFQHFLTKEERASALADAAARAKAQGSSGTPR